MVSVPEPVTTPAEAEESEGGAKADVVADAEDAVEAGDAPETGGAAEGGGAAGAPGENAGQAPARGGQDVRLPWEGKARKVDILCWAGITLSGLYYLALLPFRADLVGTHPILLEILNGSTEAIVAAAAFARIGHGTLLVVMLASIPGLMKFDPLYWWAGRLWGERVIMLLFARRKSGMRYMEWARRRGRVVIWPAMVLAPFLPIPSALIYVIAGWEGMSLFTFVILDMIGSLMWAGMLAGLGYELGHSAVVVAQDISRYGLWFTIAIVAIIILTQVRRFRSMASDSPSS
jgi:membrane-associated protein